jgi:hypothetical protein
LLGEKPESFYARILSPATFQKPRRLQRNETPR